MKIAALSIFAGLALAGVAHADSIIKNISTGYDDGNNVQLADRAIDTDYTIVSGGTAGHVGANLVALESNLPGPYLADNDSTASRWIGINTNNNDPGQFGIATTAGTYVFQTTATINAGTNLSMVVIPTLRFAVDNNVQGITINGVSVYSYTDCSCDFDTKWTTLTCVGAGLFHDGVNDINFTVLNDGGSTDPGNDNPMALRIEGNVAVDCACASGSGVPEPASLSLLGVGAMALLTRRRRRTVSA